MTPSRKTTMLAAGAVGAASAGAAWFNSRSIERVAAERRARNDRGERVEVRGVSGNTIQARIHGASDARTMVLIHCWTGTQELWHKQVDALAGELRIVTYDHRGHGLSDPAPDGDYELATLARDLEAVIDATVPAGEKPFVVGHSLGAMTLAAWADSMDGAIDERACGAALISTGLDNLLADHAVAPALPGPFSTVQGAVSASVLEWPTTIRGLPVPVARAGVAHMALGPRARDEDIELTMRMAFDCSTRARSRVGHAMGRMDLLQAIDDVEIPAIVVAGGRDRMTPIAHAERIETALPRSLGLRVDPDAGHMTPLESPEIVNAAIRELVAAVAPAKTPA